MIPLCLDCQQCIAYNSFMLFEIGRQIQLARKSRKITQAELGKALGMSRSTIGQIEKGTVQDIGVRKLIRLLEFLGLELRVRQEGRPPTLEELREEEIR
jgi:transcriptional regulator with XRE-family HTH domain